MTNALIGKGWVGDLYVRVTSASMLKVSGHLCKCENCDVGYSYHAGVLTPCSKCNLYPSDEKMEEIKKEFDTIFKEHFPLSTGKFSNSNEVAQSDEIKFHLPP